LKHHHREKLRFRISLNTSLTLSYTPTA